jgi:hypothetical protein
VAEFTAVTEELFDAIQCAGLPTDPGVPERAVADALGPAMDAAALLVVAALMGDHPKHMQRYRLIGMSL